MIRSLNQVAISHAQELDLCRRQSLNLAMLVRRLCRAVRKHDQKDTAAVSAMFYLERHGLLGSPIREAKP